MEVASSERRVSAWRVPLTVGALALLALFAAARFGRFAPDELVPARLPAAGEAPATLVGGVVPPAPPGLVAARFAEPVVLAERLDEVPAPLAGPCGPQAAAERHGRLGRLVEAAPTVAVDRGPEAVAVLRVGAAESPPGYPGIYAAACLAVPRADAWTVPPQPDLRFGADGGRAALLRLPGGDLLESVLVAAAPGAHWAVQERPGWWLAHDVAEREWLQVVTREPGTPPRIVFLDERGRTVHDGTIAPPEFTIDDRALDAIITVGPVPEVLAATDELPSRHCATDAPLCVWLTRVGTDLRAVAAHGPHTLDVPPFGSVGLCPGTRPGAAPALVGTVTGSTFALDGAWRSGPAPAGLDRYGVEFRDGAVVVVLERVTAGDPRPSGVDTTPADPRCAFRGEPVGEPLE